MKRHKSLNIINETSKKSKKEQVLFAVKKGDAAWKEVVLTTDPKLFDDAKKWTTKNGYHKFRIATIDLNEPPNFRKSIKSVAEMFVTEAEKSKIKLVIKRFINEILNEEDSAAKEAKKRGLEYVGFGRWANKKGQVVAKTEKGKLVKVGPEEVEKVGEKPEPKKPERGVKKEKEPEKKPTEKAPEKEKPKKLFLKDLIPKKSDIHKIDTDDRLKVSSLIDKLKSMADDAIAKGEKAPNYDLCQVSIPGTNLFCGGNKGVPRHVMPQFKGVPEPGSLADSLPKDKGGEVNADKMFEKMLSDKGINMVTTSVPADKLKSTQNQLVGTKVAGMASALQKDPKHPKITEPIFISKDGYVLDGHHRWAAMVAQSLKSSYPVKINVKLIDLDIDKLLPMAVDYAEEIGIAKKIAKTENRQPCLCGKHKYH